MRWRALLLFPQGQVPEPRKLQRVDGGCVRDLSSVVNAVTAEHCSMICQQEDGRCLSFTYNAEKWECSLGSSSKITSQCGDIILPVTYGKLLLPAINIYGRVHTILKTRAWKSLSNYSTLMSKSQDIRHRCSDEPEIAS